MLRQKPVSDWTSLCLPQTNATLQLGCDIFAPGPGPVHEGPYALTLRLLKITFTKIKSTPDRSFFFRAEDVEVRKSSLLGHPCGPGYLSDNHQIGGFEKKVPVVAKGHHKSGACTE